VLHGIPDLQNNLLSFFYGVIKVMRNLLQLDSLCSPKKRVVVDQFPLANNPDDKFDSLLFLPEGDCRVGEGGLRTQGLFKLNQESKPLVTVITIVFNGQSTIEKTIMSVLNQTYDNVEYIVIDGGSTDKTLEIIRKYDHKIDYWISEKDEGIADAWNKGLKLATGRFVGLLNADDQYSLSNVESIVSEFNKLLGKTAILYGKALFLDANDQIVGVNNKIFDEKKLVRGMGFMHTTCFCPLSLYKNIGLFSRSYTIAVDTSFLIACYKNKIPFIKANVLTYMRKGGVSDRNRIKAYNEYLTVLKSNDFDSIVLFKARLINYFIYALKYLFSESIIKKIRLQCIYFGVALFNVIFNLTPFFSLKKYVLISAGIKLGKASYIHSKVKFFNTGNLIIGRNTTINFGCYLDNRRLITIGNNVSIAHNCKIYTLGHDIDDPLFTHVGGDVTIEDYVCVFSNVMIMPNVKISKGAVLLSGSVVTKNVGRYEVVGGNPAKFIRRRSEELSYTLDYGYWFAL
jgi:acetyltransferase-like isoleucine patch superfamily enzyme